MNNDCPSKTLRFNHIQEIGRTFCRKRFVQFCYFAATKSSRNETKNFQNWDIFELQVVNWSPGNPSHSPHLLLTCFREPSCRQQIALRWRISLNISKSEVCVSYPKGPPGSTATVAPSCSAFPRCFKRSTHTTATSADGHTWGGVPASALHGTGEPLSDRLRQLTAPNSAAKSLEEKAEERRIQQMFAGIWPRPKLSCEQTRAVWVSWHVFI